MPGIVESCASSQVFDALAVNAEYSVRKHAIDTPGEQPLQALSGHKCLIALPDHVWCSSVALLMRAVQSSFLKSSCISCFWAATNCPILCLSERTRNGGRGSAGAASTAPVVPPGDLTAFGVRSNKNVDSGSSGSSKITFTVVGLAGIVWVENSEVSGRSSSSKPP